MCLALWILAAWSESTICSSRIIKFSGRHFAKCEIFHIHPHLNSNLYFMYDAYAWATKSMAVDSCIVFWQITSNVIFDWLPHFSNQALKLMIVLVDISFFCSCVMHYVCICFRLQRDFQPHVRTHAYNCINIYERLIEMSSFFLNYHWIVYIASVVVYTSKTMRIINRKWKRERQRGRERKKEIKNKINVIIHINIYSRKSVQLQGVWAYIVKF